jgi:hypothetical protein
MLGELNLIRDPQPFFDAECTLTDKRDPEGNYLWRCSLQSVEFAEFDVREVRMKHTRPTHIQSVAIELSVELTGRCLDANELQDPFRDLAVNCLVRGFGAQDGIWLCAWHIDRHIQDEGQEEADAEKDKPGEHGGTPHFVHPDYHFQYGGEGVWGLTDHQYGQHLLLESPRLAHPPLDVVLATDFVLSNYYGRRWQSLRQEGAYRRIVRDAHDRIWRPYAIATALKWGIAPDETPWDGALLWPHLLASDADILRQQVAAAGPAAVRRKR